MVRAIHAVANSTVSFYDWITFACLHTHTHTLTHTHLHTYTHSLTLTHSVTHTLTHTHTYSHTHTHSHPHSHTHTLFFTQSLFTIHLVHVHITAVVNNAPVNAGVQRSLQDTDLIPFSHIPRGGIAGSC